MDYVYDYTAPAELFAEACAKPWRPLLAPIDAAAAREAAAAVLASYDFVATARAAAWFAFCVLDLVVCAGRTLRREPRRARAAPGRAPGPGALRHRGPEDAEREPAPAERSAENPFFFWGGGSRRTVDVSRRPLSAEPPDLLKYAADVFPAANRRDYALWDLATANISAHAAAPGFAADLAAFRAKLAKR